jgi:hypothetical protein
MFYVVNDLGFCCLRAKSFLSSSSVVGDRKIAGKNDCKLCSLYVRLISLINILQKSFISQSLAEQWTFGLLVFKLPWGTVLKMQASRQRV